MECSSLSLFVVGASQRTTRSARPRIAPLTASPGRQGWRVAGSSRTMRSAMPFRLRPVPIWIEARTRHVAVKSKRFMRYSDAGDLRQHRQFEEDVASIHPKIRAAVLIGPSKKIKRFAKGLALGISQPG